MSEAATAYALVGAEPGVRALVDRFYDLMDLEPAYAGIRSLHPDTLDGSRDKLYWFLSGWLGGPDLYQQRFGHPRLRARHLPYEIGIAERDQWMACMQQAMRERARQFEQDPDLVQSILVEGAERAREVARETLDEVRSDPGRHHHASGTHSHPDRVGQRRQQIGQPGLPHPVAQVRRVAAVNQEHVCLPEPGHPSLRPDGGQSSEFEDTKRCPAKT